jgi:uncharacterized membrane protein YgdD (TMEM256/DUF423 family)
MNWTAVGSLVLAVAVMLGAFGAHGLRGRLDAYSIGIYERAVFYHFVHALGLLLVPLAARTGLIPASAASWVCVLLLGGILIFCGSLYALAITGVRVLGAMTPLGGLAFIAAWLLLAWAAGHGRF